MFVIFRWWYFTGMAGIGLTVYGAIETNLALRTNSEPIAVTMADLESDKPLAQPYVRLGEHVALELLGTSTNSKKVADRKTLYPIVGVDHPIVEALEKKAKSKSDLPGFSDCHVFALRNGPAATPKVRRSAAAEGVVFGFDELSEIEQRLVSIVVPSVDRAAVRVIELDRRPVPLVRCLGALVAGLAFTALAIRLYRRRSSSDSKKPPKPPKQPAKPRPVRKRGEPAEAKGFLDDEELQKKPSW